MTTPRTATATKLTELLMRKNATERRAMLCGFIPLRLSTHAPSASPPMPLAGTMEPIPSSDHPSSLALRQDILSQKIGRNMTT